MGKKKKRKISKLQNEMVSSETAIRPLFALPKINISKKKIVFLCILVFFVGFLVYASTLTADFIWDDEYLIINNTQIKSFQHFPNIFKTWVGYGSENINNFYRPIQELSDMIDYSLWGLSPGGFHLTNTLLHSFVGMLVFLLFLLICREWRASLIGALFWTVHPVHSEAVAYIAGRADSLYSLFMLLSLILFIKFVNSETKKNQLYTVSIFCFIISLLAKEMVFIVPLLLVIYMFYFLRGTEKNKLFSTYKMAWIPYGIIVGIYGILRATVLRFAIAPQSAFQKVPFIERIFTFFKTIIIYFKLMIFPTGLHMERMVPISRNIFMPRSLFAFLFVSLLLWLAYWTYKKNKRFISFGIVWFFVSLLPVSNIIPINSFMAEHWIYMASIGIFMIIGIGLSAVWQKIPQKANSIHYAFMIAVLIPLFLYGKATIDRNKDWNNEVSFFTSTLKYHPRNARLYLNLGNTYYENKDIDKAIEQYKKAISINKKYAVAYGNIGSALLSKGKPDEALEYLKKAIAFKSNYPIAHYNVGIIYFNQGRYEDALKELDIATDQLPQLYQAHNMKSRLYLKLRRPQDAIKAMETSLSIYSSQPGIQKSLERLKKLIKR